MPSWGGDQSTASKPAAEAVLKLVDDQLEDERTRKASLEARGVAVISTSGTLTTLLLALAALVTDASGFQLSGVAQILLMLGVAAFLLAAVLAVLTARPGVYGEVKEGSLREIATLDAMNEPEADANPKIAIALVEIIVKARRGNEKKARLLMRAVSAEVAGFVLVAAAVVVILAAR